MTSTVRNGGETLEFGPFQLQPDDRLFRNGVPLALAPKEAAVLRTLADAGGRDIVESVYGRGYRLTVPVRRVAADRTLLVWPNTACGNARAPDALMGQLAAAVIAAFGRSRTHGVSALGLASSERLERASGSPVAAAREAGAQFVLVVNPSRCTAAEFAIVAELRRTEDDGVPLAQTFTGHPQSLTALADAVARAAIQRLPERSLAAARHAVELDPSNCLGLTQLAVGCSQLGEHSLAVDTARRAYEQSGRLGSVGLMYASVCARAGEQNEARRLVRIAQADETGAPPSIFGLAYAALGEEHETRIRFAAALRERCLWLPMMLHDPRLDHYASRPWFRRLSETVNPTTRTRRPQLDGRTPGALMHA